MQVGVGKDNAPHVVLTFQIYVTCLAHDVRPVRLTKVTVNLTPRATDALETACRRARESRTDAINRALLVYAVVLTLMDQGEGQGLTVVRPGGDVERVWLV